MGSNNHEFLHPKVFFDFFREKYTIITQRQNATSSNDLPDPDSLAIREKVMSELAKFCHLGRTVAASAVANASRNQKSIIISAIFAPILLRSATKAFFRILGIAKPTRKDSAGLISSGSLIKSNVEAHLKAIKEVESQLREALLTDHPDLPRTLWSIDLTSPDYCYQRHVLILSFLAGEKYNVEKSLELMINHLQYRVEHDIPPVPSYVDDTSTPPLPRQARQADPDHLHK